MTGKFDILFLGNARPEFTHAAWAALVRNTEWSTVNRVYSYFDCLPGSSSSRETVITHVEPSGFVSMFGSWGSPVAIMLEFLEMRRRDPDYDPDSYFVKIDNDLILCPGWLMALDHILTRNSQIDLLGIEARHGEESSKNPSYRRSTIKADFIGGIGAMRYGVFDKFPDMKAQGRFGFGVWQGKHPEVVKAWLEPPLPVFLLDHLPFEPWATLSETYLEAGIQRRQWGYYGEDYSKLWEWWEPEWKERMVYES